MEQFFPLFSYEVKCLIGRNHRSTRSADISEMLRNKPVERIYIVGIAGRELWVLAVGESPDRHVLLRPEVKYVANIHGNEVSTT